MTLPEYQVSFTEECRRKLEGLTSPEAPGEVLATILNDLGNDPYAFKSTLVVDERGESTAIRFVRTGLYVSETIVVQPLTLFFGIVESRKQVLVVDVIQGSGFGLEPDPF